MVTSNHLHRRAKSNGLLNHNLRVVTRRIEQRDETQEDPAALLVGLGNGDGASAAVGELLNGAVHLSCQIEEMND